MSASQCPCSRLFQFMGQLITESIASGAQQQQTVENQQQQQSLSLPTVNSTKESIKVLLEQVGGEPKQLLTEIIQYLEQEYQFFSEKEDPGKELKKIVKEVIGQPGQQQKNRQQKESAENQLESQIIQQEKQLTQIPDKKIDKNQTDTNTVNVVSGEKKRKQSKRKRQTSEDNVENTNTQQQREEEVLVLNKNKQKKKQKLTTKLQQTQEQIHNIVTSGKNSDKKQGEGCSWQIDEYLQAADEGKKLNKKSKVKNSFGIQSSLQQDNSSKQAVKNSDGHKGNWLQQARENQKRNQGVDMNEQMQQKEERSRSARRKANKRKLVREGMWVPGGVQKNKQQKQNICQGDEQIQQNQSNKNFEQTEQQPSISLKAKKINKQNETSSDKDNKIGKHNFADDHNSDSDSSYTDNQGKKNSNQNNQENQQLSCKKFSKQSNGGQGISSARHSQNQNTSQIINLQDKLNKSDGKKQDSELTKQQKGKLKGCSSQMMEEKQKFSGVPKIWRISELKDCDNMEDFMGIPEVGDVLAYKLCEVGPDWVPRISEYRCGKVRDIDSEQQLVFIEPWPNVNEHPLGEEFNQPEDNDEEGKSQKVLLPPDTPYDEDGRLCIHCTALIQCKMVQKGEQISEQPQQQDEVGTKINEEKENGQIIYKWNKLGPPRANSNCTTPINFTSEAVYDLQDIQSRAKEYIQSRMQTFSL